MREELIQFETAKLAKDKGFFEPCQIIYVNGDYRHKNLEIGDIYDNGIASTQIPKDWLLAPTQSLLQRWLRKVHNIDTLVERCDHVNKKGILYTCGIYINDYFDKYADNKSYRNYEDALEVGLQEALKLIKN